MSGEQRRGTFAIRRQDETEEDSFGLPSRPGESPPVSPPAPEGTSGYRVCVSFAYVELTVGDGGRRVGHEERLGGKRFP